MPIRKSVKITYSRGFSLMELMIAVAIVGIVSTLAYPSYQSYITDSKRSVAQADLLAFAAQLERHKLANFSYACLLYTSDAADE